MLEIFIVYKTDTWHSYASRDLIGICSSVDNAIDICQQKAKRDNDEKIDDEQVFNLRNIKQTQGYKGEGEFVIEPSETDILL